MYPALVQRQESARARRRALTERLGEYELIAELARGGMGRVFLARRASQAGFERLYAVKVLHDAMADEPEAVAMLIDEANIASKIHHPNVVAITDIGNQDGSYFVVMDYVEGCTLVDLLRRSGARRPARLVVPLVIDALRGLHAAHELVDAEGRPRGLIHRDFSPQNLLVGVDGVCRVADFGVAKARARLTHTRPNLQKGKISFMAPEQLESNAGLDRRVDIWAAGVVLWTALTGEHPFWGQDHLTTIRNIFSRAVPQPSTVGLRPPRCLDAVCLRALERDRGYRFPTAQAMADELQAVAVRYDLLAPQSEIADWVGAAFHDELEARRRLVRISRDERHVIELMSPKTPPRVSIAVSSSPDFHDWLVRAEDSGLEETSRLRPPRREGRGAGFRAAAPSASEFVRTRRARRTWASVAIAILAGAVLGFALTLFVLDALWQPLSSTRGDLAPLRASLGTGG
jgi:serine/threonine protein kinase